MRSPSFAWSEDEEEKNQGSNLWWQHLIVALVRGTENATRHAP